MGKLILDCEMEDSRREALEKVLSTGFEADMPLLLELLFVSAEEIRALNKKERGKDAVTDVLSFPAAELKAGEPVSSDLHGECVESIPGEEDRMYLGSVVICRERAREQAAEYGHSYAREVCYLAVHGMLHCLGYDHETEEQRKAMRAKEEELMAKLGLGRDE